MSIYFVSYMYTTHDDAGFGFGNCEARVDGSLDSKDKITTIQNQIKVNMKNYSSVTVVSFCLLRKE